MATKLKPCPFCGGVDLELFAKEDDDGLYEGYITCRDCGVFIEEGIDYYSERDAKAAIVELWNRRVHDDQN